MVETLLIYVCAILLVAAVPEILDILSVYRTRNKLIKLLEKLEPEERQKIIKLLEKSTPGIQGLTRGVLALTVIVILGIAIIHILVGGIQGSSEDNTQIINNILSMLAGLLAAITGFYFGGKATVRQPEEGEKKA